MTPESMAAQIVQRFGVPEAFGPVAYYDPDGDCIECVFVDDEYYAQRLDKWVTVYYGRKTNDVVGSLIKNVTELLGAFPGMKIDIHGNRAAISHLLRGPAYIDGDEMKLRTYRALVEKADLSKLEVDLMTV